MQHGTAHKRRLVSPHCPQKEKYRANVERGGDKQVFIVKNVFLANSDVRNFVMLFCYCLILKIRVNTVLDRE